MSRVLTARLSIGVEYAAMAGVALRFCRMCPFMAVVVMSERVGCGRAVLPQQIQQRQHQRDVRGLMIAPLVCCCPFHSFYKRRKNGILLQ